MKHLALILAVFLLCSLTVAPAMAGTKTKTVVDGVHLLEFDASPTKLDPKFYEMDPTVNFVVDGDQFYWMRIGSEKAKDLTSVWWIPAVALSVLIFPSVMLILLWPFAIRRYFPQFYAKLRTPVRVQGWRSFIKNVGLYTLPISIVCALISNVAFYGALVGGITHTVCDGYVDLKASDDTILLKVDKLHPESNTLYMKSGINLTKLTHLPCSGNNIYPGGVNPP